MAHLAHYEAGDTFLHRLHPMTKLLVVVLTCVASFLFESWIVPAALAAFLVFLHAPRAVGFGRLLAAVRPLPLFVALIVLANILLVHRPLPLRESVFMGFVQSLRVVVVVVAGSLFLAVTDPVDLADCVLRFLGPLKRIGLGVGELSLMVMIAFSFIPFMADESRRLRIAQAVRCGFPKRPWGWVGATIPLLVPLVIGVFRRSDEIDDALRARCYRIDAPRSSLRRSRFAALDYSVCAALVLVFLAGLYAKL